MRSRVTRSPLTQAASLPGDRHRTTRGATTGDARHWSSQSNRKGQATSTERRLVKRAQLARMQGVAALAQEIERRQTDLEVLGHRPLVEGIGGPRQLDLAVQWLVGHAQQRTVRHA